ncbi:hypothetical protein WAI453_009586 [Rhynchosporium graminicola]
MSTENPTSDYEARNESARPRVHSQSEDASEIDMEFLEFSARGRMRWGKSARFIA